MTRTAPGWLCILLVASPALLGGCLGKAEATTQRQSPKSEFTDKTGGIEGFVLDDQRVPIVGASVQVIGLNMKTNTTNAGGFAFNELEPKQYILLATHPAFIKKQAPVQVSAGQPTKMIIQMEAVPPPRQFVDAGFTYNGQIGIGACAATVCHSGSTLNTLPEAIKSSNVHHIVIGANNWETILFEVSWDSASAISDQLRLALQVPQVAQPSGSCGIAYRVWQEDTGRSPLRAWLNRTEFDAARAEDSGLCPLAEKKWTRFTVSAFAQDPPASAYAEQRFTLFGTISYNEPLDASFTRIP